MYICSELFNVLKMFLVFLLFGIVAGELPACKLNGADIVFVVDTSAIVVGWMHSKAVCRMKQLVSVLEMGEGQGQARMALFPSRTTWRPAERISLTQTYNKRVMKRAFHNFEFPTPQTGTKAVTTSLAQAVKHIESYPRSTKDMADKIVIYMGIGKQDKDYHDELKKEVSKAESKGVTIFGVLITESVFVRNFHTLVSDNVQRMISARWNGFTTMIEKHLLKNCEDCKAPKVAIVFLVDYTIQDGKNYFTMIKNMIKSTVRKYVGKNEHQAKVGIVSYGHAVYELEGVRLGAFSTRQSLLQAIDATLQYSTTGRDHTAAMEYAIEKEFNSQNYGDDVTKIMVMISDGTNSTSDTDGRKAENMGFQARDHQNKIQTFFVAINKGPSKKFDKITGRPDHVIAYADFTANVNLIVDELCKKICLSTIKVEGTLVI